MNNHNIFEDTRTLEQKISGLHHEAKSELNMISYLWVYFKAEYALLKQPQMLMARRVMEVFMKMSMSSAPQWNFANWRYPTKQIEGEGTTFTSLDLAKEFDRISKEFTFHPFFNTQEYFFTPKVSLPAITEPLPMLDIQENGQSSQVTTGLLSPPSMLNTPRSSKSVDDEGQEKEKGELRYFKRERVDGKQDKRNKADEDYVKREECKVRMNFDVERRDGKDVKNWRPKTVTKYFDIDPRKKDVNIKNERKRKAESPPDMQRRHQEFNQQWIQSFSQTTQQSTSEPDQQFYFHPRPPSTSTLEEMEQRLLKSFPEARKHIPPTPDMNIDGETETEKTIKEMGSTFWLDHFVNRK